MSEDGYQWVAEFKDGKRLMEKESGNYHSFKDDVLPRCSELETFGLIGQKHRVTVDMKDGSFNIDGLWIGKGDLRFARSLEEEYPILTHDYPVPGNTIVKGTILKPIYGKRTTRVFDAGFTTQLETYFVHYIGWEADVLTSEIVWAKCQTCEAIIENKVIEKQKHSTETTHINFYDYQYGEVLKKTKHIVYIHPDGLIVFA